MKYFAIHSIPSLLCNPFIPFKSAQLYLFSKF